MTDLGNQPECDLFGFPVRSPRRGGRVAHVPIDEVRGWVRLQRDRGLSVEAIAASLEMGATTAMRHYAAELYETGMPGRVGRPRHTPSDASRVRVSRLWRMGLNQSGIARAMGISVPTLRLHYPVEVGSKSEAWSRHATDEFNPGENEDGT